MTMSHLANQKLDSSVRGEIASAIGTLGETSVLPQLLTLLADDKLDSFVRQSIASAIGTLGETSVLPQLLTLLADDNLASYVRHEMAKAAVSVVKSLEDLEQTVSLLQKHNVFSELYQASQQVGEVRLYWIDKKKKLIRLEVIGVSKNQKTEKPKQKFQVSKIFEPFRKRV